MSNQKFLHIVFSIGDARCEIIIDNFSATLSPWQNYTETSALKNIHYHTTYEFFYIRNDKLEFVTENSKTDYEQSVIIIPPFFKHYSTLHAPNNIRFLMHISQAASSYPRIFSPLTALLSGKPTVFSITPKINAIIDFIQQTTPDYIFNDEEVSLLLKLLLIESIKNLNITFEKSPSDFQLSPYFLTIDDIINKNYTQNITLDYIASILHLSKRQTSRIIQKEFHSTLPQLLNDKKLSVAASLLTNTDLSVKEIIEQVNFLNDNYFYSLFKKKYKLTPGEYRKEKLLHTDE